MISNPIPAFIEMMRETGEWLDCEVVHDRKDAKITDWQQARCSICGKWHTTPYMYNWDHFDYCPNCGAKMENSLAMNKKTKAEWICLGHRSGFCKHPDSVDYKCSNCGYEEYTLFFPPPDKCPNCGADMRGDKP